MVQQFPDDVGVGAVDPGPLGDIGEASRHLVQMTAISTKKSKTGLFAYPNLLIFLRRSVYLQLFELTLPTPQEMAVSHLMLPTTARPDDEEGQALAYPGGVQGVRTLPSSPSFTH